MDVPGVTDWIFVRVDSNLFALHADTKRKSVEAYLKLVDELGEDLLWQPTVSKRGKETAVVFGPEKVRHTPFYLYFKRVATRREKNSHERATS